MNNIEETFREIRPRVELVLEYRGNVILDEKRAWLLKLINEKGSILVAAKTLGIPYSRAWEWISKIENILGLEIVKKVRGGKGGGKSFLTKEGRALLDLYFSKAKEYSLIISPKELISERVGIPDILYAGSHDPLAELIISTFAKVEGLDVEFSWIGSCAGLLAIMLNEADIAGVHLIDPVTKEYNIPYIRKYMIEDKVILVRGYTREICLAYRPDITINSLEDAVEKGYRIINRNVGSGTRIFLEYLLAKIARVKGIDLNKLKAKIPGFESEARTHFDVAEAIISGRADYGLTLTYVAKNYGLKCIPLGREHYDFIIRIDSYEEKNLDRFINFLKKEEIRKRILELEGYDIPKDSGCIIYRP
ncbi:MAG: substrate-binding domain-containing protein [Candidatus Njordarchaeales archaeon]